MPIKVTCNNCGGVLHAPDDAAGKRGRCPTCGTVLAISGDAPRVPASTTVPPPAASGPLDAVSRPAPPAAPGPLEGTAGLPAPPRPLPGPADAGRSPAFPRPPAAGQSSTLGVGPPPAVPAKANDPFMRRGVPAAAAAAGETARDWNRVRRGLGWVQTGVVFCLLAAAALPLIELASQFGLKLPDQDPGYLKVDNLSAATEIRFGVTALLLLLGGLFLVIGRLGATSAPPESFGRGLARAAAWSTLFAFLGLVAAGVVTGLATASGGPPPRLAPQQDVLRPGLRFQERAERYAAHLFLDPSEPTGQVQRIGTVALLVFGLNAELWFLIALGRYAAALQHPPAARRLTGLHLLIGVAFAAFVLGLLLYNLYGEPWVSENLRPRWNDFGEKGRAGVVYGGLAAAAAVFTILYLRAVGGVKRAIREAHDPAAA